MKILITGTDGYIGVLLASILQKRGHSVTGLDTGYYRSGLLYGEVEKPIPQIRKDIRHITEQDLIGYDAVVHLAELSNDTLGQLNPKVTFEINHLGSVDLARKSKRGHQWRY
jgi:nucleoside-diphosphate-sugar epimerase